MSFERFLEFDRRRARALAARTVPTAHGLAHFSDELPLVYYRNFLLVERAADAATLAAEADAIQGEPGLLHRKVAVDGPLGRRLADGFRALGWEAIELVVMQHDGRPLDGAGAEEVDAATMEPFWLEAEGEPEEVRQLAAAHHGRRQATPVRYFAVRDAERRVVGGCELFSDGRTAQVESVETLPAHRGRGHASAVVGAAVSAARASGHDAVYLVADANDWPAGWYERLGFRPVGELWDFLRTPAALRAIRLRTPRLELRLPTGDELRALGELAREGIHPPERMPFYVPWTDAAHEPGFVEDVVAYHLGRQPAVAARVGAARLRARRRGDAPPARRADARDPLPARARPLAQPGRGRARGRRAGAAALRRHFGPFSANRAGRPRRLNHSTIRSCVGRSVP